MRPRNRLGTAKILAHLPNPSSFDLNCAISSAYYGVFDAGSRNCANCYVGRDRKSRNSPAWRQEFRGLEHGFVRKQFQQRSVMARFPLGIQLYGQTFVLLQGERYLADYDPSASFNRDQALVYIDMAEDAIHALDSAPMRDRRAFAVWMHFKDRPQNPDDVEHHRRAIEQLGLNL